jgi:hypothetical protein
MFGSLFGRKKEETPTTITTKPESLNLIKERAREVRTLCLEKGITTKCRVAFVLDYSISMNNLYNSGEVQEIFERLFPVGFNLDSNREVDLFIFDDSAKFISTVNLDNYTGIIDREIRKKHRMGGTSYEPAISLLESFYKEPGDPVFIIFLADGDCSDKNSTTKAMIRVSDKPMFFQFVGIGNASMDYLEKLDDMDGRTVDNANFFRMSSQKSFTDTELYNKLMTEYPSWLAAAKSKGIV